jgi:hypothetical protein
MKKTVLYAVMAILLGILTMVSPLILLKPRYYELLFPSGGENILPQLTDMDEEAYRALLEALNGEEATPDDRQTFGKSVSHPNLSSAGLIVIPSLLFALGVSLYAKKRIHT